MGSLIGDLYQGTLQYPCPFLLTLGVHMPDAQASRNWAYMKSARATTNAGSYMARFLPDMQERKADWDIVLKALDDGQQLVDLHHQLALFAPPAHMARAEQAARSIFRSRGSSSERKPPKPWPIRPKRLSTISLAKPKSMWPRLQPIAPRFKAKVGQLN
jgi:conjugal transfer ATP-binding protein TraC